MCNLSLQQVFRRIAIGITASIVAAIPSLAFAGPPTALTPWHQSSAAAGHVYDQDVASFSLLLKQQSGKIGKPRISDAAENNFLRESMRRDSDAEQVIDFSHLLYAPQQGDCVAGDYLKPPLDNEIADRCESLPATGDEQASTEI